MASKLISAIFVSFLALILSVPSADAQVLNGSVADTYYVARGFDSDGDGQVDHTDNGLLAVELPDQPGVFLHSELGGTAAPLAYYPNVTRELTEKGLSGDKDFAGLIGNGTFARPQLGSALGYRTVLYATEGVNGLKAFYLNAIQTFTPMLGAILQAEEYFRTALRVDPNYEDALNGLLEAYYARAEGFMLIGNDYLAKAYRHKFDRDPNETKSIVELEIEDIENALMCYDIGFREFIKLFNPDFIGLDHKRKPHLDIDAEYLFFTRRFTNPNKPYGEEVAFEVLRGQKNAIGVNTRVLNDLGNEVGPVQGSPNFEAQINDFLNASSVSNTSTAANTILELENSDNSSIQQQWDTVDAPVKFHQPYVHGAPTYEPGSLFELEFRLDADQEIQVVELVIEFDYQKIQVPNSVDDLDFDQSVFPVGVKLYGPGSVYGDVQLLANQVMIRAEASTPVSGDDLSVVTVPFWINSGHTGDFYIYISGSADPRLSGYKDIALLYRLAAAHTNATAALVQRLYNQSDADSVQNCIEFIQKEVERIGEWFEHLQVLLAKSAEPEELEHIEFLQTAINSVASELSGLSAIREFIRSGANAFGYPDEYVPFFNSDQIDTFDAIKRLVLGDGGSTSGTYGGYFGQARETETAAILSKNKFDETKDRIRSEIFTINEQAENRLSQICGRINADGEASLDANDPIDYDMRASPRNLACVIGQKVSFLRQAQEDLVLATEKIQVHLNNIELEEEALEAILQLHENKVEVMREYGEMQARKDIEICRVNKTQKELNSVVQAQTTLINTSADWTSGGPFKAAMTAAIQLSNGMQQARMEEKKGELTADKTRLATEERIRLTEIDSQIFEIQQTKNIEQMVNKIVLMDIEAQIAEIDVQLALGKLNQLIMERDELLARRSRAVANLGEMSFADPSFRLTQFNIMKDAETQLELLKRWLYLMTRAFYYKWSVPDDYIIQVKGLPDVSIHDVNRIQVVGAVNDGIQESPLQDQLTAADYVQVLLAFNDQGPLDLILSPVVIEWEQSNNSARYSLREDFLRIVRTADTPEETQRVREAFREWLTSEDRLDEDGNLVIEFDTLAHLENYNLPVTPSHGTWTNFALRSYATLPLWNHKITQIGVALKAVGLAFKSNVSNVSGNIQYGGAGYLKGDTDSVDDFRVYQMRQWRNLGNGRLEPVDVRTVSFHIPTSAVFQADESDWISTNLNERPVASTLWRLQILASQLNNIEMENIEDIFIYINSKAYQRQ